jgi:thioredoxin reductase (NADPH)
MGKPVIWTVDDDPDVLRAVERDLRRHYGDPALQPSKRRSS